MGLSYHPLLVALSALVAACAAFAALSLAGRLLVSDKGARPWWLAAAAVALGGGIWSMHFIGMLALNMPLPATYDVRLTLLSFAIPIAVTGAGLYTISRFGPAWRTIGAGGIFVGLGVATMHYVGMAGMQMPGAIVTYDPVLVAASVAIAIASATGALWLAFHGQDTAERVVASLLMGGAISGMHYTGMAAATFTMEHHAAPQAHASLDHAGLAFAVAAATAALLVLGWIAAYFDRKLAMLTRGEAEILQANEKRYRCLLENAADVICVLDRDGTVVYGSSSALHVLGFTSAELAGGRFGDLVGVDGGRSLATLLAAARSQPGAPVRGEMCLRARDGGLRDFEATATDLTAEPAVGGFVLNLHDVTERKALIAKLETISETDPLTGLLNRRGFLKLAERELSQARRTDRPLTVVMVDIDHFKQVNDGYGHAAGDLVLAMVAQQCRSVIRDADILARFGGEEFVLLLVDATLDMGRAVVSRLRAAIGAATVSTIKGEVSVTASFGLASLVADGELEGAIRLADEALYEAKLGGRNCIRVRA